MCSFLSPRQLVQPLQDPCGDQPVPPNSVPMCRERQRGPVGQLGEHLNLKEGGEESVLVLNYFAHPVSSSFKLHPGKARFFITSGRWQLVSLPESP